MKKITRRGFLISGAAVGGGLFVGYLAWPEHQLALRAGPGESIMNAWLKIADDGQITVVAHHVEMGQGVHTSLPILLAEELDADWHDISIEQAPVDPIYVNVEMITGGLEESEMLPEFLEDIGLSIVGGLARLAGMQVTGGSSSIRDSYNTLRVAGAGAKAMLIETAARNWGVDPAECSAADSIVSHAASGRAAGYGELAAAAALLQPPSEPSLKDPADFNLINSDVQRLDIPAKVDGTAGFGIDVDMLDVAHAAIRMPDCVSGSVKSVDASALDDMPGVEAVVTDDSFVAVVAATTWEAKQAVAAIEIEFDDGAAADLSSKQLAKRFEAALTADGDDAAYTYRDEGDVDEAYETLTLSEGDVPLAEGDAPFGKSVEATYRVPYLAHACMEPMNCTAGFDGTSCRIEGPVQAPSIVRDKVADALGIEKENVSVVPTLLGGGFGRRLEPDVAIQAALASREAGRPVKLVWDRETDTAQGPFRPMAMARMSAVLGSDGLPLLLHGRGTSQSVTGNYAGRWFPSFASDEPDASSVEGLANMPYEIANRRLQHVLQDVPIPVGFWRSVGNSFNAFFVESFMDELATAAGQDPFAYRRALLGEHPRFRRVLDELEAMSGFHEPVAPGAGQVGRGLALHRCFGSIVGEVAEVRVIKSDDGDDIRVERVSCVIDCGDTVHPDTIKAQMEGGIIFGLTAALRGQVTFEDGRAQQSNFHDYEMLMLAEAPVVETRIIRSGEKLGGVGEPSTPPIAPAVCNAIFAATGRRIRDLPIIGSEFSELA